MIQRVFFLIIPWCMCVCMCEKEIEHKKLGLTRRFLKASQSARHEFSFNYAHFLLRFVVRPIFLCDVLLLKPLSHTTHIHLRPSLLYINDARSPLPCSFLVAAIAKFERWMRNQTYPIERGSSGNLSLFSQLFPSRKTLFTQIRFPEQILILLSFDYASFTL